MPELIASIIFGASVIGIILYSIYGKAQAASFHQLSEARRWYNRGYITKKQVEAAVTDDGILTLKGYYKLKSIVDRRRMIKALINEESPKLKIHPPAQVVGTQSGTKDESPIVETNDTRLVEINTDGVASV